VYFVFCAFPDISKSVMRDMTLVISRSTEIFRHRRIRAKNHAVEKFLSLPFAKRISTATFHSDRTPIPASWEAATSAAFFIQIRKEIT
jgi:hypothetical protein